MSEHIIKPDHVVEIRKTSNTKYDFYTSDKTHLFGIQFQDGARGETGVNGITVDGLFIACIDHLMSWQSTDLACEHNTRIIALLEQAVEECHLRHVDRAARGVSGQAKP